MDVEIGAIDHQVMIGRDEEENFEEEEEEEEEEVKHGHNNTGTKALLSKSLFTYLSLMMCFFLRHGSFRRKIYTFAEKLGIGDIGSSILVQNSTLRLARNMHHTDTYLRLKQTAIPHLCPAGNTTAPVCVSPREGPRREY